jgi:mannuronan synthase
MTQEPVVPPGYRDPRRRNGRGAGAVLNIAVILFMVAWSVSMLNAVAANSVILGLGVIGVWRHGWGLINFIRAVRYQRKCSAAKALPPPEPSQSLVVLVTFYDQSDEDVAAVTSALARSFDLLPGPCMLVAAHKTVRQKAIVEHLIGDSAVLRFVKQDGRGKREALADGLAVILESFPEPLLRDASLLLLDGDSVVTDKAVLDSLATLRTRPGIGAVVVNEIPLVQGSRTFGIWRLLRSQQRNKLMLSFALSDRTLVLTGRFAMLRAKIIVRPDVVNRIRRDFVVTARAHIPMLTGDDKTTWLEVLRRGYGMTYLPNAYIYPIESPDQSRGFLRSVFALNHRYSGNMARANLHPDAWREIGDRLHFRYGLIDQRISMWTSLLTPVILLYLLVFGPTAAFVVFLTYVLLIKNVQAVALSWLAGHYDPWFPYLIFFDQVMQSLVKVRSFAFLHRQAWTNQGILARTGGDEAALDRMAARSMALRTLFFGIFVSYLYVLMR